MSWALTQVQLALVLAPLLQHWRVPAQTGVAAPLLCSELSALVALLSEGLPPLISVLLCPSPFLSLGGPPPTQYLC